MKNKDEHMVDIKRRKALLGVGTGAVVATVWHKPMIKSVVLPAHAEMSEVEEVVPELVNFEAGGATGGVTPTGTNTDVASLFQKTVDAMIPEANAQQEEIAICIAEGKKRLPPGHKDLVERTKIMAEAINNGDGTYEMAIVALISGAAPSNEDRDMDECEYLNEFIVEEELEYTARFRWEGTLGLDSDAIVQEVSGCLDQDEEGVILAVDEDAMTMSIEMTYFNNVIEFDLEAGSIELPMVECFVPEKKQPDIKLPPLVEDDQN